METDHGYLPQLESREQFFDYLGGYGEGTPSRNLIKTYMLETAGRGHRTPDLINLFPERIRLQQLDDTLYHVEDTEHKDNVVGLLEKLEDRHPVVYTTMKSNESKKWIQEIVDRNPWLDRLWLSSPILFELWNRVPRTATPDRYVQLGFDHEARYESLSYLDNDKDGSEDTTDHGEEDSFRGIAERRKAKVTITERLSILSEKLESLIKLYDPLHSLVQLQVPGTDTGGHRLYYDGHATNRTKSFVDHRATIKFVLKFYRTLTERVEERLWFDTEKVNGNNYTIRGTPVTIRFHEPLSTATFERFIDLGFKRQTSLLRIGGYISRHGATKVHIAAIDRHLWQPLLLEVTSRQLLGVLPRDTCGNTIHRLVTNIQRSLDPNIEVWLGSETYESDVAASMSATTLELTSCLLA